MTNNRHKTAAYKIIPSQCGNRYSFFCELSGMLVCTTGTYYADNPEAELSAAWESEGKNNFNLCHLCGRWVNIICISSQQGYRRKNSASYHWFR